MKTYRIYTEDKNRESVIALTAKKFDSFTVYDAKGYWKGEKEDSLVIEIIDEDSDIRYRVNTLAYEIRILNKQDTVLIQIFDCNVESVRHATCVGWSS